MTSGHVCQLCQIGEHMLQPRAHPHWDDGELVDRVSWPAEELCACDCAKEGPAFVDVHLPPFDGPLVP